MARKAWSSTRQWDASRTEERFEELLKENGFNITGIRCYISKTEYKIEKDGTEIKFAVYNSDNSRKRGDLCYGVFLDWYNLYVEHNALKAELEKKGGIA